MGFRDAFFGRTVIYEKRTNTYTKESREKLRLSHLGIKYLNRKKKSLKDRRKLSEIHKKRGTRPPSQKGKMPWNFKGSKEEWEKYRIIMLSKPEQCEVCGAIQIGKTNKICWDHDHETDKFRGWICFRCNFALGLMKDNAELLEKLASYLRKNREEL